MIYKALLLNLNSKLLIEFHFYQNRLFYKSAHRTKLFNERGGADCSFIK